MLENGSLLNKIKGPEDVKALRPDQLGQLCGEIRQTILQTVSRNGGHLASNLGTVELTVALHRVFCSPQDQIVWDVSHQCYTHKLLTGRYSRFSSLRTFGGISGFAKPCESEHDIFGCGHSSTSISAACGLAKAKTLSRQDGYVIAVIGDGSLTGGLAYEGMNNAGRCRDKLIVILNDNEMSISKNVGAIARHLAVIRAKPLYFRIKDNVEAVISHIPLIGGRLRNWLFKYKSFIKNILYHSTIFEEMGFAYLGPVDGHDIGAVTRLLERAKAIRRPSLIHVMTVKGKGYTYAENNPNAFHGVGAFDLASGAPLKKGGGRTFSAVFGDTLEELARKDERVCAVSAAMTGGTGLSGFASDFQTRFFDVGIAEEHAVVFSAGLAKNGLIPVFAVYSTFLQRAYDQIIHDVALQKLKVIFAVDRAGIVGEDGETHQGIFDAAFLSSIPNMEVYSPAYYCELSGFLQKAVRDARGPVAIRYPKGEQPPVPEGFVPGCGNYDFYAGAEGGSSGILLVTYGRLFGQACRAAKLLEANGLRVSILKLNRIKPIEEACYAEASRFATVLFFEEGIQAGGIGEHFCSVLAAEENFHGTAKVFAIRETFVRQGKTELLLSRLGLDAEGIARSTLSAAGRSPIQTQGRILQR